MLSTKAHYDNITILDINTYLKVYPTKVLTKNIKATVGQKTHRIMKEMPP